MQKTLKDLYYGKIRPIDKAMPKGSEGYKASEKLSDIADRLSATLTGDSKALLDELLNAQGELILQRTEERFIQGFRLGARMAIEIMIKDDGSLHDLV